MKELILTLMDHKGLVRALIGLAIFFVVASVGVFAVRTFGTTSPHKETKKEKKSDDIKLSKEDKETIDDYTNDTKQLVALLQSNSWIATNGEKSIDFGDNTITVIDPGSSKSNSKPKSFVIQSMTQETEDGTGNEIYNCSIEINGKSHLLMVTKPKSSSDITVAINLSDTGLNQFVRVQSASDLKVTGFDANMEEALMGFEETKQFGINFFKNFVAVCLSGGVMAFGLYIFPYLVASIFQSSNLASGSGAATTLMIESIAGAGTGWVGSSSFTFLKLIAMVICLGFLMLKSGSIAKDVLGG